MRRSAPPTFSAPGPFFTTWVKRKCDFRYPSKSHIPKRGAFSVFKIDKENNRVISCRRYEKNGTGCRTFCSKKLLSGESLKIFFHVFKLFLYETAAVYWYFDHSDRLDLGELWFLGVAERADFSISWCYDLYRKTIDSGLEPELVTKTITNPFTKKWTFKFVKIKNVNFYQLMRRYSAWERKHILQRTRHFIKYTG